MNDLLIPRFKIIANYPNSKYNLGCILYRIEYATEDWYDDGNVGNFAVLQGEIEKYPHLFRKLEWWEDRTSEEMPKYIKNDISEVYLVKKWDGEIGEVSKDLNILLGYEFNDREYHPATEKEYNDYINSI